MLGREMRAQGKFPGWTDLLVAAMARNRGLPVATRNTRPFPSVDVLGS